MPRSTLFFVSLTLTSLAAGCSFVRDFGAFQFGETDGGPGGETCDGTDEDGDGNVDEGITRTCGMDVGACSTGTETCTDGTFGACEGGVEPGSEVCEGSEDENCDGSVDEGCACTPGTTQPCGSDVGECRLGMQECQADATWGICEGAVEPVTEECDGVDNDCDSELDEPPAGSACPYGCNQAAGRCNTCMPGMMECVDATSIRVCADGSGFTMMGCPNGCSLVRNECNLCMPNRQSCLDTNTEQTCAADGSGYAMTEACTYGCEDTTYHQCRYCQATGTRHYVCTDANNRGDCNALGFFDGGLNCLGVYGVGCNPATGNCYGL